MRRPPSGSVDYNDGAFREIRVRAIYALRSLSVRSPLPEAGIRALTEMLEDVGRFGERDGAAWALDVLADDDLLVEIDEQVIVGATGALVSTLTTSDDPEVQRTALQTLRRIATMSEFKSRLISQESSEKIVAAMSSSDEARRQAGAEVLRAIVHTGSEEWREEVRALVEDGSEEVRRIGVGIQAQAFPDDLVREAEKEPTLEQELTAEVEAARQSVAAEFRARGRRRFQEGRWEDAIENYLKYVELRPDDLTVQRDLAEVYLLARQYAEAEARARITIESASTQRVLDQFTIVAALVLAGRPDAEERARLLELGETSPMRFGYWSFDTLREHLNDENTGTPEARAEVLKLILLIEPPVPTR
jgi:tetratricopeptide (TPR) repeat protein